MAGGKRSKLKKIKSPTSPLPTSTENDDNLIEDLLAQLDSRDSSVHDGAAQVLNEDEKTIEKEQAGNTSKKDSRRRFRARQSRKETARTAQQSPDSGEASDRINREIEDEDRAIRRICDARGLELHEINPDGHCLFSAVADQLALLSVIPPKDANYQFTRRAAADYIESHPDDFIPFLPSADGGDGSGTDTGLMRPEEFNKYCASIRDTGTWGGEPEILALANAFSVPIHVVQWGNPPVVVHSPSGETAEATNRVVQISYHRRMYGLGEHYNSLRPRIEHHLSSQC